MDQNTGRPAGSRSPQVGVMFPCRLPPGELVEFARASEAAGVDQVWIVEDAFFGGGIATAATALAATEHIVIGVGIVPAAVRNVAYLAMEVATLANLYPGRLHFGVGHGMLDWLEQVGAKPASPLGLLGETLEALQALLRGDQVTRRGRYVHLENVELAFPPATPPPVLAGVRGPRSVELSARSARGTILAEPVSPQYVAVGSGDGPRRPAPSITASWPTAGSCPGTTGPAPATGHARCSPAPSARSTGPTSPRSPAARPWPTPLRTHPTSGAEPRCSTTRRSTRWSCTATSGMSRTP